jgi:hypothetical protein
VDRRRDGRLVLEAADDRQLTLERLERLEDRRQLEGGALAGRRPLLHDRAVRQVQEPHARLRRGGCLREQRARRHHRVEERQADGDADTPQERPPGEMPPGDEHGYEPSRALMRIWNGALFTMPSTIDENR